ncbi:AAEL003983-PA [Aedes aegypti]|uniref:AAEL003983-PA n=1 Tax=Aedes aegypti TaxID=7159 RepID=Q17E18_AEDAE|nr:AAEL003983-PA [Aedes aegypti]
MSKVIWKYCIAAGLIEVVILLFAGSWSDRVGLRKPCILIPIAADTISLLALIICAIFMREIPLEVTGILHQLISALGGGGHLILTGVFSYLTIVTTESQRTFRFACASIVISVIPIIARFFSGHIFKALGFLKLCILCTTTHSIALLYGIFVLKEPDSDAKNKTVANQNEPNSSSPTKKLFDMTLATDCINVITKKRAFNIRKILMFTFVVYFINFGAAADTNIAFSIAQSKFHWVTNLGIWGAYDALTTQLGTMLAIGVLGKRFGVSDYFICAFSVCFTLIAKPIMAYAVSTLKDHFFYVATSIDIFDGSKTVAIRSIVSKLVEQNEIGKINSLLGVIASAQSIVYPTIYSVVFLQSRDIFIGAVFMLAEVFLLVSLGLYIVSSCPGS